MKQSSIAKVLLLLAILSIATREQDCARVFRAAAPKIEQLETGHFSIKAGATPTRYNWYRYTYKQKFVKGRVDVGLTINYIDSYLDTTGVDFSIRPIAKQTYFDAVFVMNVNARWRLAHIHFLATSRDDFKTGTYVASQNSLFEPTGDKPRQIVLYGATNITNFNDWDTSKKVMAIGAMAYISGIKCDDIGFNIKIYPGTTRYLNNNVVKVQGILSSNKKPIESLYITYFMYLMMGRVATTQFPPNYDFLFNTITNVDDGQIGVSGMTGVNSTTLRQYIKEVSQPSKRLLADFPQMNMTWFYSKLSKRDVFRYKKVFDIEDFGIRPAPPLDMILRSTLASNLIKNMAENQVCIGHEGCEDNGGQIILRGNKLSCVICPVNKTYNIQNQQCQCIQPLISSGDKCVEPADFCGLNRIFVKGNCFQMVKVRQFCDTTKNEKFDEEARKCGCPPGSKLTSTMQGRVVCAPICPENHVVNYETFTCQCPKGSYMREKECVKCEYLQIWDTQKLQCVCKPGVNLGKNGECILCSAFGLFNEQKGTCQCLSGYSGNGVICRKINLQVKNTTSSVPPTANSGATILERTTKP